MITLQEKSQIKGILSSPQWQTIERMQQLFIQKIQDTSVVRESEWETLKAAIQREAEVEGVKKFIKELYDQAT